MITDEWEAARRLANLLIADKGFHAPHIGLLGEDYPVDRLISEHNARADNESQIDPGVFSEDDPGMLTGKINGCLSDYFGKAIPDFDYKINDFLQHYFPDLEWLDYMEKHGGWDRQDSLRIPGVSWD